MKMLDSWSCLDFGVARLECQRVDWSFWWVFDHCWVLPGPEHKDKKFVARPRMQWKWSWIIQIWKIGSIHAFIACNGRTDTNLPTESDNLGIIHVQSFRQYHETEHCAHLDCSGQFKWSIILYYSSVNFYFIFFLFFGWSISWWEWLLKSKPNW